MLNSESDILQTLESFMDSNVVSLLLSVSIPPFAVLVIIKYFYSKWLWKKLYRFHGVPNLNGQWKGFAIRDGDKKVKREVIVTIEQDWDNISIRTTMLDSKHMNIPSFSECIIAGIETGVNQGKLKYSYKNNLAGETSYIGYHELLINDQEISGQYITTKPTKGLFVIHKDIK